MDMKIDYENKQITFSIKNHEYYEDMYSDSILLLITSMLKKEFNACTKLTAYWDKNEIHVNHSNHSRFYDIEDLSEDQRSLLRACKELFYGKIQKNKIM